jgi:Integrase zinc binding domain
MDGEPGCIHFPKDIESRRAILQCYHNHPLAGHPGIHNTIALALCHFEDMKELRAFVEEYVKGCAKCQETKTRTLKKTPLYRLNVPAEEGPFQSVTMDLITDLPLSSKYNAILTIIDQGCSKALCFLPCTKNIMGEGIAMLYLRRLLPWFGLPCCIISDRDPCLMSHFSKELVCLLHIKQNISTAFHPCTDGASEHANQKIEQYLCLWVPEQQEQWADYLSIAEFIYNSWPHNAMGQSAHELLFGF